MVGSGRSAMAVIVFHPNSQGVGRAIVQKLRNVKSERNDTIGSPAA